MLCQKILIIFDYTGLYPRPCWRCYTLKRVKLVNERGEELRFYNGMWPSKAQPLSIMFYSLVFNFSCWIFLSMPRHWLHERLTKKIKYIRPVLQSFGKQTATTGGLSLDWRLNSEGMWQEVVWAMSMPVMWMLFMFDPQCFCMWPWFW